MRRRIGTLSILEPGGYRASEREKREIREKEKRKTGKGSTNACLSFSRSPPLMPAHSIPLRIDITASFYLPSVPIPGYALFFVPLSLSSLAPCFLFFLSFTIRTTASPTHHPATFSSFSFRPFPPLDFLSLHLPSPPMLSRFLSACPSIGAEWAQAVARRLRQQKSPAQLRWTAAMGYALHAAREIPAGTWLV